MCDGRCPVCAKTIHISHGLVSPMHINNLLKLLCINCKICDASYSIYDDFVDHEKICMKPAHSSPPPPLLLFSLDESSVIPRIDKDAPLHIIKTKMKESPGGNASCKFKSGGPRPTVVAITPTAYKPSEEASKRTIRKRSSLINSNIFCHS